MFQAIGILAFFVLIAVLMITKRMQTIIALPILAIGVAAIAGVPLSLKIDDAEMGIMAYVIDGGMSKMAATCFATMIAAWLGQLMTHTGVTKSMVRAAAELGGDRVFLVSILLSIATALLCTVLSGHGSTIMVGSIVLPIMLSLGVPPTVAACLFLASRGIGLILNMTNWKFFATVTGVEQADVQFFSFILCGLTIIAVLTFMIIEFKRNGLKFACANKAATVDAVQDIKAPFLSLFTPLIPIILVVFLKVPLTSALIAGIVWCFLTTLIFGKGVSIKQMASMLNKSAVEGVSVSSSAVILMMGIGMVLNSLTHPYVMACINPFISKIIPATTIGFVVFFIIVAPLSLYRGPMNLWGLGSGIASVVIGLGILPVNAVFGAFLSSERIQAIADPTNTHSVWVANYVGCDVNQIMIKLLPYLWAISAVGVVISAIIWM